MSTLLSVTDKIFLFDEYGTPAFEGSRETDVFAGVSCLYNKTIEEDIFIKCQALIGLNNPRTKKSTELSANRSIQFAELISSLDIDITVTFLDLNNGNLQNTTDEYSRIGNVVRLYSRGQNEPNIRERKIPQILHSNVLAFCMFEPIANLLKDNGFPLYQIEPYIDQWSVPKSDLQSYLVVRSKSIEERIAIMMNNLGLIGSVKVKQLEMLRKNDNSKNLKRKRLIDCITGVVSKSFNDKRNTTHTSEPLRILQRKLGNRFIIKDETENTINFMLMMMEDFTKHSTFK